MDLNKHLLLGLALTLVFLQGCQPFATDDLPISASVEEGDREYAAAEGRFDRAQTQLQDALNPTAGATACSAREQLLAAQSELDNASSDLLLVADANRTSAQDFLLDYSAAAEKDLKTLSFEVDKGRAADWKEKKELIEAELKAAEDHLDAMGRQQEAIKNRVAEVQNGAASSRLASLEEQCLAEQQAEAEKQVVADNNQSNPNDDDGISREVVAAAVVTTAIVVAGNDSKTAVAASDDGDDGDDTTPPTTTTTTTTTTTATSTTTATATATTTTTGT